MANLYSQTAVGTPGTLQDARGADAAVPFNHLLGTGSRGRRLLQFHFDLLSLLRPQREVTKRGDTSLQGEGKRG
jgi:hypothetical protein